MLKQSTFFLVLFLCLFSLYAQDSVRVLLDVYPKDLSIKIDDKTVSMHGKERTFSLVPGKYTLSGVSGDSVLTKRNITIHENDLFNMVQYRVIGSSSQRKFRMQLGGQWMFNEYEESPFTIIGKKRTGEEVITTPVYAKPVTFATLDLGFVNKNNYYFGLYSELLNVGGMFSFGKEVQLHPAVNLYVGGKLGFMMEFYNSYYTEYRREGEMLWDYPSKWNSGYYDYNGWINGVVQDSSGFVVDAHDVNELMRFASLDAQVSLGRRAIKFYLRSSLWLGSVTDYDSYTYTREYVYSYDTTYTADFDQKLIPLPSLSAGVQFNFAKRRKIGVHGPYGSIREQSSTAKKNEVLGGTKHSTKGTRWFGGSFKLSNERFTSYNFSNYDDKSVLYRTFSLSTITRFYPADNFILGPSFQYLLFVDRSGGDVSRDNLFLLGADIGYSKNVRKRVVHYGLVNPQLALGISRDGYYPVSPDFFLTVKFGAIYMLNKYVGLQVEPSFPIFPMMYSGFTWDLFVGFTFSLDRNFFSMGTSLLDRQYLQ